MGTLVLAQEKADERPNKIKAILELLQALELVGCVVTIDAIVCQKEIAQRIVHSEISYEMSSVYVKRRNKATAFQIHTPTNKTVNSN